MDKLLPVVGLLTIIVYILVWITTRNKWWGPWAGLLILVVSIGLQFLAGLTWSAWFNIGLAFVIILEGIYRTRQEIKRIRRLSDAK